MSTPRAGAQVSLVLGKVENTERFLSLALYQGVPRISSQYALQRDTAAGRSGPIMSQQQQQASGGQGGGASSSGPASLADPTIIVTAFRRNRFFMFTRREPAEMLEVDSGAGR